MAVKAPVVASKTLGPSQVLEFMGIVLDSVRMEARLPDDKLVRIKDMLQSFTQRRSARLVELQSLIGTLQFACKVVVPGRTFLQRVINLTRGVSSRFHHVRLNKEFFKDLEMWKTFLSTWNGRSFFLDTAVTPTPDLEMYTDASGPAFQGIGPPCRPPALYHPAFPSGSLRDEVLTYANWGLAPNTNRSYSSGEKRFIQFCFMNRIVSNRGDILPASEGTLIYFASYLARTVRHGTIKLYLAAVRNLHISCGHGDPLQGKLLLKKVLRGILRFQGQSRSLRQPVTPRVLLSIRPFLQGWLGAKDFLMVWAAFTLAFFGFLRCSEFTYQGVNNYRSQFELSTDAISFYPSLANPQHMSVTLKASKTDFFRQGNTLTIARTSASLCAVTAMQNFFLAVQPPPGPLFSFQSGRLLTRSSVSALLRDAARQAGLPYKSLKGHSFRIGAASAAAAAGLPDWLIKVLGRWSSDCYQLYIRTPPSILLSAAPRMACSPGSASLG
ncbi:hypothetical protein ACROYT_G011379 [Oculina patagonica]